MPWGGRSVPGEGEVGSGLGEGVGTSRGGPCEQAVDVRAHDDVAGQEAGGVQDLPAQAPGRDLPQDLLPRLDPRVEAGGVGLLVAEEGRARLVLEVVRDLGDPAGGDGAAELDALGRVDGEGRA